MEPISVMPCVYVLRLEGDDKFDAYYYVGSTHQLNIRVAQHIALCGAKFTKLHKFVVHLFRRAGQRRCITT